MADPTFLNTIVLYPQEIHSNRKAWAAEKDLAEEEPPYRYINL